MGRNAAKVDADGGRGDDEGGRASSGSKGRARFSPPTLEEVAAYCRERKNGIDPGRFLDYHAANGWKLSSGNPLRDWKAAIRTWEARDKARGAGPAAASASTRHDLFPVDEDL